MSKYTTEVRYICETAAGYDESKGFDDVDQIIEDSIDSIFSFDFPIFDENYRNVICTKILRHYYTREIGFETVGLWKLKLQTRLNEIMPFYNQLYESQLIKFNPLYDVDMTTTHAGNKTGESNREENKTAVSNQNATRTENGSLINSSDSTEADNKTGRAKTDGTTSEIGNQTNTRTEEQSSTGSDSSTKVAASNYADTESATNYDLYSDTPQGALTDVDDEEYLTNARKVTDSKTKSGKRDDTEAGETKSTRSGETEATENGESSTFGQTNTSNSYDEQNSRITTGKTSTTDDRSSSDSTNRNDLENLTGSDKFTNTESYVLHVIGKQAGVSFSKLLTEFRETFLNIDMEIINALSDLFFNLW